jgi:hypothetical protein
MLSGDAARREASRSLAISRKCAAARPREVARATTAALNKIRPRPDCSRGPSAWGDHPLAESLNSIDCVHSFFSLSAPCLPLSVLVRRGRAGSVPSLRLACARPPLALRVRSAPPLARRPLRRQRGGGGKEVRLPPGYLYTGLCRGQMNARLSGIRPAGRTVGGIIGVGVPLGGRGVLPGGHLCP